MENLYLVMLAALAILAVIDIMVGVSNDAVNFLNSGVGSKAVSFRTLLIVASIGILCGSLFSSGMMEIARSGIFVPAMFSFEEVMIIFLAVMISDIILFDIYNSVGFPTSTTVSIIFELLGAGVCVAIYKIVTSGGAFGTLGDYINTEKTSNIVSAILLSVLISFAVGATVMYISRIIFSFHFDKKIKYFGAIFGGAGITSITYFILFKGLKGSSIISPELKEMIDTHQMYILLGLFLFWTFFSQIIIWSKINIFRVIIVIGTFALALAFAGQDLVNFIGVPIGAIQAYEIYVEGGKDSTMLMGALASSDLKANFWYLLIGGAVMVYTICTSKKARGVIQTEVNLTKQSEGSEKFDANNFSRTVVRGGIYLGRFTSYILPKSLQQRIDKRFEAKTYSKTEDAPAFDMVRASVNLIVASILLALATTLKLPLSTTYVTFMVAMGSSFADRAWDRESAVYRIAGVFNVIGGWFLTALVAFTTAVIITFLLVIGKAFAFFGLLIFVAILLYRSNRKYTEKVKEEEKKLKLKKKDIATAKEIVIESSSQIAKVILETNELYTNVINSLSTQDLAKLKSNKKKLKKIEKNLDELKANVYYFIKNIEDASVEGSRFYIIILGYIQDMVQSIGFITTSSYTHVNNNHKKLKLNQIKDLKSVNNQLQKLFDELEKSFVNEDYPRLNSINEEKEELLQLISKLIEKQIIRIRTNENSPKNSKLYFGLLLETNDLINASMNLVTLFQNFNTIASQTQLKNEK